MDTGEHARGWVEGFGAAANLYNRVTAPVMGNQGVIVSDQDPLKLLPLPWRPNNIKYASNEIYLDVIETIDATIDAEGKVLSSAVYGRIESNSRLSGMPDINLTLSNSHLIDEYNFHPERSIVAIRERSRGVFRPRRRHERVDVAGSAAVQQARRQPMAASVHQGESVVEDGKFGQSELGTASPVHPTAERVRRRSRSRPLPSTAPNRR